MPEAVGMAQQWLSSADFFEAPEPSYPRDGTTVHHD